MNFLAQTDFPSVPANFFKWTVIVIVGIVLVAIAIVGFIRSFKPEEPTRINDEPPIKVEKQPRRFNHDLAEQRHGDHERRLLALELWRTEVTTKMEEDKLVILQAGEDRASKIHDHITRDREAIDHKIEANRKELSALVQATGEKIDTMCDRVIAMLKNTGAI